MAFSTIWDDYIAKMRKYDAQIDREWSQFGGATWAEMTDEQKANACLIAERQGIIQRHMAEAYERTIRG